MQDRDELEPHLYSLHQHTGHPVHDHIGQHPSYGLLQACCNIFHGQIGLPSVRNPALVLVRLYRLTVPVFVLVGQ
ncbi:MULTISPECIES: hypothetical protein [unclassified Dysgonomonas]|uniref:hypothetical protein n=1 Tax=unclassified Dysgonomonas TaxID=2630389 RepID=UPI0024748A63|nr:MULTISPECIES: hypothetical protein [unclassified Dysgonomonas]